MAPLSPALLDPTKLTPVLCSRTRVSPLRLKKTKKQNKLCANTSAVFICPPNVGAILWSEFDSLQTLSVYLWRAAANPRSPDQLPDSRVYTPFLKKHL